MSTVVFESLMNLESTQQMNYQRVSEDLEFRLWGQPGQKVKGQVREWRVAKNVIMGLIYLMQKEVIEAHKNEIFIKRQTL